MSDQSKQEIEKGTADTYDARIADKSSEDTEIIEDTSDKYGTTQRGLKSRHIQLIALGGCIGTVS